MNTQPTSADIFTRINDPSEKALYFSDLVKTKGELIGKKPDPSAEIFTLMPLGYSESKLTCKASSTGNSLSSSGMLILTFFLGGEKYFLQASYELIGEQVILHCGSPLFHLQRRLDYRIRIPTSYPALFEIVSVNGAIQKKSIPLLDLSGGGCRIKMNPKEMSLKIQDQIKGHLYLPDRKHIAVTGSVRHVHTENIPDFSEVYGVQFVGLSEPIKNKIIAVVMDLYREFFAGRT